MKVYVLVLCLSLSLVFSSRVARADHGDEGEGKSQPTASENAKDSLLTGDSEAAKVLLEGEVIPKMRKEIEAQEKGLVQIRDGIKAARSTLKRKPYMIAGGLLITALGFAAASRMHVHGPDRGAAQAIVRTVPLSAGGLMILEGVTIGPDDIVKLEKELEIAGEKLDDKKAVLKKFEAKLARLEKQ